jgi:hypothetical protein
MIGPGAHKSATKSKPKRQTKTRRTPRGSRKQRIAELVRKIEDQLDVKEMKITLADFIRLTQLERELEQEDQPREIVITWKDPSETSAA